MNVEVQKTLEFEISDVEWQFLYATLWETIDSFDDIEPIAPTLQLTDRNETSTATVIPSKKKKDSDDIHVRVKVLDAALVVTSHGERLGQFSVHDIEVAVDIDGKTDALLVAGHIGSALLRDVRSGTSPLYQTILVPKDKSREMVLFSYYSRGKIPHTNVTPLEEELGDCDSSFKLQFRKVEIVAMVGFILTVKDMVLLPIFARLDLEADRAKAKAAKVKLSVPAKHSSEYYLMCASWY